MFCFVLYQDKMKTCLVWHNMTDTAQAAGALTFSLMKSKQKSSTAALIDPLNFHYGKSKYMTKV